MAQKTAAVNKDDIAYTSPSTAENQNESEKVNARAPTNPAPQIAIEFDEERASPLFSIILLPKWVMVQNRKRIVNAEQRALMAFTIIAALSGWANNVKNLPKSWKTGFPGG